MRQWKQKLEDEEKRSARLRARVASEDWLARVMRAHFGEEGGPAGEPSRARIVKAIAEEAAYVLDAAGDVDALRIDFDREMAAAAASADASIEGDAEAHQ